MTIPITIAYGDGIGPEITKAVVDILQAAKADVAFETIEVGQKMYNAGYTSGIPDSAWESLKRTKVLLKGPITTPQGGGYKSLNVTLRKTLGLFANVRPTVSYAPYVSTQFPHLDLVIVRENEEDTYSGIEHRQTKDVYQCLKLITRYGSEQIIRYAFQYARQYNRKKVTCLSKDNIMKMTDGLFHKVFNEIAEEYPDIEANHLIIDIGAALIAAQPERFDVICTLNLYGDIVSDIAAQVAGSVGLAGSANIGQDMAMFEAIHGSAPDIAGKDMANPSGLLNAAIQMLVHIGDATTANTIENAWLTTLEQGIHTADIFSPKTSKQKVGTKAFAEAVITNLGKKPAHFKTANYQSNIKKVICYQNKKTVAPQKKLVGVDIFLDNQKEMSAEKLAEVLSKINSSLKLVVITSRGLKIWPNSTTQNPYLQHCCCRFQSNLDVKALTEISVENILELMHAIHQQGLDIIKTENLYVFDGELGFSLAQGQ